MERKDVLVISGKDQKLTGDIFHFLRKIGLDPVKPKDYSSQATSNPYQTLLKDIKAAFAIVILLTGDDETKRLYILNNDEEDDVRLRHRWYVIDDDGEEELCSPPQPHIDVLFASGVAFAKRPKHTILVKRGHLNLCSYFKGRCLELGDTYERRYAFIEMLRSVGYAIDLPGNEWIDVGDFSDPDG